jgi:hypothetical protein
MAQVNVWNQIVRMELDEIIRFQLSMHCTFNSVHITEGELDVLLDITKAGDRELNILCKEMIKTGRFASQQSIRNTIDSLVAKKLIVKARNNGSRKRVSLAKNVVINTQAPILVDIKVLCN